MKALKVHLFHHRFHMLGCVVGALIAVVGGIADSPVISIVGAVICGGFCLDMVRMTIAMRAKRA